MEIGGCRGHVETGQSEQRRRHQILLRRLHPLAGHLERIEPWRALLAVVEGAHRARWEGSSGASYSGIGIAVGECEHQRSRTRRNAAAAATARVELASSARDAELPGARSRTIPPCAAPPYGASRYAGTNPAAKSPAAERFGQDRVDSVGYACGRNGSIPRHERAAARNLSAAARARARRRPSAARRPAALRARRIAAAAGLCDHRRSRGRARGPRGRRGQALCRGRARAARARARRRAARRSRCATGPTFPCAGSCSTSRRDRVPTRARSSAWSRCSARLRFNHLELYTEHTFAYPGHEVVWRDASPITRGRRALARSAVRRARHRARREPEHVRAHGALAPAPDVSRARRVARRLDHAGRRAPRRRACSRPRPRTPRSRSASCASSRATSRAGASTSAATRPSSSAPARAATRSRARTRARLPRPSPAPDRGRARGRPRGAVLGRHRCTTTRSWSASSRAPTRSRCSGTTRRPTRRCPKRCAGSRAATG